MGKYPLGMARKKRRRDFQSTMEMLDFFKKTGAQGGRNRAANMSKKKRSESARQAALARWSKRKKKAKGKKP